MIVKMKKVSFSEIYKDSDIYGMTLDEINKIIVAETLRANDNNMAATAEQLGISRTTLWRYIKRTGEHV